MARSPSQPWPHSAAAALGAALALALIALSASALAAPGLPAAGPARVSSPDGAYLGPDVAVDAAGRALIVWHGEASAAPGSDIYGRLYGSDGRALGEPFRINAEAAGEQRRPSVAARPGLGFVVAWDTNTRAVWARLLDPDGAPLGGDIAVNATATGSHFDPDVAAVAGGFLLAWEFVAPSGGAGGVALRRFDAEGAELGDERLVAPEPAAIQLNPALAVAPDGAIALVWEELDELSFASRLRLRRFDAAGDPVGEASTIAESAAEELRDPAVSAAAGGLLMAWVATDGPGATRVVARRIDGEALAPGAELTLSDAQAADRFSPAIAAAADGSAMLAWGSDESVAARGLDPAGAIAGDPLAPRPADETIYQLFSVAAAAAPGEGGPLWVVWSESQIGGETESAIYAQRYVDQIYQIALPLLAP